MAVHQVRHFTRDQLSRAFNSTQGGRDHMAEIFGQCEPNCVYPVKDSRVVGDGKWVECIVVLNLKGLVVSLRVPMDLFGELDIVPKHEIVMDELLHYEREVKDAPPPRRW